MGRPVLPNYEIDNGSPRSRGWRKFMNELIKQKLNIIKQLSGLCAHCNTNNQRPHACPVQEIAVRIECLRGVPLIVNNEFKGVLFSRI